MHTKELGLVEDILAEDNLVEDILVEDVLEEDIFVEDIIVEDILVEGTLVFSTRMYPEFSPESGSIFHLKTGPHFDQKWVHFLHRKWVLNSSPETGRRVFKRVGPRECTKLQFAGACHAGASWTCGGAGSLQEGPELAYIAL